MKSVRKSKMKPVSPEASAEKDFPIVGIGASAGGLEAFQRFLRNLPDNTGMAFVFIQHQAPTHPSALAELLKNSASMPVHLATKGMVVRPNNVYVIPPNTQMTIDEGSLTLIPRPIERVTFLPVDHFFESLAAYCKKQAIGVILSGTASDGTLGLRYIKAAGGITFAQDDKSAKFSGMPHHAVATDVVDFVLPPEQIASEIVRIANHPLVNGSGPKDVWSINNAALAQIFSLLRRHTGVDFTHYKQSTVMRRITRRMLLHRIETLEQYVAFLKKDPKYVLGLYEDMLIHVTSFFRDPETFETLKNEIFPRMMKTGASVQVRVWVPGCSTGEEVYSIAMAFEEYLGSRMKSVPVQIFGTDISENAIEKARLGLYPFSISSEVSPERLARFFIKTDDGYQMSKLIRGLCVFARHDVVKDPPFSKMDLISCRNLLIYLGPVLQKKVVPIFHYALNHAGYLLLGSNESITGFGDFFFPVDKKYRIYARKSVSSKVPLDLPEAFSMIEKSPNMEGARLSQEFSSERDILREAERLILSRYAPASVITDDNFDIIQFRGHTGEYLTPPQGHASFNIIRMAKEGFLAELRAALLKARKEKVPVQKHGLQVQVDGETRKFNLEVTPYRAPRSNQYHYIVSFDAIPAKPALSARQSSPVGSKSARVREAEIEQMRSELASTKEFLQSIIEEQEITNAELRAANEEILSSNEELQSTNEEMETAKEELESSNEELTTVNEELQIRNAELTHLNNDLNNLLASVYIPIVILGVDMRIRRFTPMAERVLNLIPSDIGRPVTDINLNINVPGIEEHVLEVIETMNIKDMEVKDRTGCEYSLQIRPYMTSDNRIEGVILVLINIDRLKRNVEIRRAADYVAAVLETIDKPFVILDEKLCFKMANSAFCNLFQVGEKELKTRPFFEVADGRFNVPILKSAIDDVLQHHSNTKTATVEIKFSGLERPLEHHVRRMDSQEGKPTILIGISGEVNSKKLRSRS